MAKSNWGKIGLALLTFLLAACSRSTGASSGQYSGSDGSNGMPSSVNATLALTGDGNIVGIWKSTGVVTEGQLAGTFGYFSSPLHLRVLEGSCTGQFSGDMRIVVLGGQTHFVGTLGKNPACPDQKFQFDFVKK